MRFCSSFSIFLRVQYLYFFRIAGDLEYFPTSKETTSGVSHCNEKRSNLTNFQQPDKNLKSYLFSKREELKLQPKRRKSLEVVVTAPPPPPIDGKHNITDK